VVPVSLKKRQPYEDAVKKYSPYKELQEPCPSVREGIIQIADHSRRAANPAFVFVNNRLEGHAPGTIEAAADQLLAEDQS